MSILKKSDKNKKTEDIAPIFQWAGALSGLQKFLIFFVTIAVIGAGFYFFIFKPKFEKIEKLKQTLKTKKRTLVTYEAKAKILPQLEEKLKKLKEELNYAMAALPNEKEIPVLLTEISRAGTKTGLKFINFKPKPEQVKEGFYAVIPVSMVVQGRFHQHVHFFDEVSRLYRIVNINSISMQSTNGGHILNVSCEAETYRFVNKEVSNKKKGKK